MKKIFHLSTCSTCKRIIKELNLKERNFEFQDIKFDSITETQLEVLKKVTGSYESLFSKTSRKYKELGLKDKKLGENDFKNYILTEYTFLKRPVIIVDEKIFVGNAKNTISAASKYIETKS